ncbi:hypothetical protein J7K50_03565, partial [bacterium]|nr:hypothetical protein [bacterium]
MLAGVALSISLAGLGWVFIAPPAYASEPAEAVSALDDPHSVDWGARFDQAKAAKDRYALLQILELAPLPEWTPILDKTIEELMKHADVPNLDKPEDRGSIVVAIASDVPDSLEGAIRIETEETLQNASIVYVLIERKLPASTASLSFILRPPVKGVKAELFDMTLVKSSEKEYVSTSFLFLIGPDAPSGEICLTGSVIALDRNGGTVADIPIDINLA